MAMQLFKRSSKAEEKWRIKAWFVDPKKTKLIFVSTAMSKPKHVPPWMCKKQLDPSIQYTSHVRSGPQARVNN